ncbi:MAG: helix-turn-helix transcriptional regulator [Oscillospiraceae bacterium]|nr:helix-turn-helix transcriptional regulator [Oscillospiraceae bacterium]
MLTLEFFSERLSTAIKKAGITQASLAEKAETSSANISNYCRGKSFPPLDTLSKIADVLNVSIDWLCATNASGLSRSIRNLGDVARLLASMVEWECIDFGESSITEQRFIGYSRTYSANYPEYESIEQIVPAIIFRSESLRIFLEDLKKMKKLLAENTFDKSFYTRWLEDRLSSLCTIEIEKNEYGLYEDPYSVVLPF